MSKVLLPVLLPILLGPLTFVVMQGLKALSAAIDRLPVTIKRFLVAGIAVALTLAGKAAGVDLHCDPEAGTTCLEVLDKDAVKALLSAAIAFLLHWAKAQTKAGKTDG